MNFGQQVLLQAITALTDMQKVCQIMEQLLQTIAWISPRSCLGTKQQHDNMAYILKSRRRHTRVFLRHIAVCYPVFLPQLSVSY
jgi:hypothetical protein